MRRLGRHRGKFTYKVPWPRGLFPGFHRGVYEPKLEWLTPPPGTAFFVWTDEPLSEWSAAEIRAGYEKLAAQQGTAEDDRAWRRSGPSMEEVRDVVRDELTSTPIFTGLKYGRFGDSEFDLATPPPVCPAVSCLIF